MRLAIRVGGIFCLGISGLICVVSATAEPVETAESLVKQALVAELAGDVEQRRTLLATAIALSPEYAPARWHGGMVRVDDAWLTVEAVEEQTAKQGLVFEYRQLRDRYAGSATGQEALARWCRQKQWTDLEKMHWTNVLLANSAHREARSRLAVREYGGMLLTKDEIDQYKEGQKAYDRAVKEWQPRLHALAKSIASDEPSEREHARTELRAIDNPEAIPAMQQALSEASEDWAVALVRVIGNIKGQTAVETLIQCSVDSSQQAVRQAAAEELKRCSMFSYVPTLLGALETPIELTYYVKTFSDGFQYGYEALQERPDATHLHTKNHLEIQSFTTVIRRGTVSLRHDLSEQLTRSFRLGTREIAFTRNAVAATNQRAKSRNERIVEALNVATEQQFAQDPQQWWQWWANYNQLQRPKQTVHTGHDKLNVRRITIYMSCFLRGTQVWTDTGAVAIEDVRVGDKVLSQDQETGELAYKLVLDTTIRMPSPSMRLGVENEEIVATLGHPIWVAGTGWQMSKELEVGELLHGVHGSVPIDYIQPGPEAEAYNLVVADFHNYFVGKDRVLVHDNHMRRATDCTLPGYVPTGE